LLAVLFSRGLGTQWKRSIQPHLEQYIHYVQQDLGNPPEPERAQALADQVPVTIYIYQAGSLSFSTNGKQLDTRALEFHRPLPRPPRDKTNRRRLPESHARHPRHTPADIAFDDSHRATVLRVQLSDYTVYYELSRRKGLWRHADFLLLLLLALAGILMLSFLTIRRQLSPIRRIKDGVGKMSLGNLDHRIDLEGSDDLATLGNSIDAMAEHIGAMLDAKRQLLLAISHELRSPLARARVATELLPESVNRERISDDLREMELMITDIMESERLQQNHAILNRQELNLSALVQSVVDGYEEAITTQLPDNPLMASADDARLRILLRNLINNALQHGAPTSQTDAAGATTAVKAATVEVCLQSEVELVRIDITDRGPGIAAEHIAAITEPFYRPDASRARATGGFGLGLTLCKLITEAHGGSLHIDSEPESRPGTRVIVRFPIRER
jgi:signal transduction histidine kinase